MLDHLRDLSEVAFFPDIDTTSARAFTPVEKLSANQQFDAKAGTADLYERLGVLDDDEVIGAIAQEQAGGLFNAFIGSDEKTKLAAVGAATLPETVRPAVAMLSQYQWDFVAQAKQLRSMAVSKIVTMTDHHDPRVKLTALKLLGTVTEVALFTERVEVKKVDMTPDAIEDAIREKLKKFQAFIPLDTSIEDAVLIEAAPATLDPQPITPPAADAAPPEGTQ